MVCRTRASAPADRMRRPASSSRCVKRDIELADRTERSRHAPHLPAHASDGLRIDRHPEHGQRLTEPPGGDARLMHGTHIAGLRGRHRVDQRREPLIQQHEKGRSVVHATMGARPHDYTAP